jgi:hypothetical protein
METAAAGLAEALLALLGHDAATCLAALHAGDAPPRAPGMGRRARQYRRIVRVVGGQVPWANGGPDRGGTAERTDTSEAEVAQRTLTGWASGQADRVRGDS